MAGQERLAYEEKLNKYGETTKRVIGIQWLDKIIETAATHYSLVRKKGVKRLQERRSLSPGALKISVTRPLKDGFTVRKGIDGRDRMER
ncbi:hypothetical protein DU972_000376 [Vibrio mimicus]